MRSSPQRPESCTVDELSPRSLGTADETLDENLHFGRAWHRYRKCYRHLEAPRILDAGCGTGRSSLAAACLNPGATVLGVDSSPAALQHARQRADAAGLGSVSFHAHDLTTPPPESWGRFDFIVCRDVLGGASDPAALLGQLARLLAPEGLLLATFPSRLGRRAARALRQAIDALAPREAGFEERNRIGLDLLEGLRTDHPIAASLDAQPRLAGTYPACDDGRPERANPPSAATTFVLDALTGRHEWTLDEAARLLNRSGLRVLYGALPWRWQPDRVLAPGAIFDRVRHQIDVERIEPANLTRLIDALDDTVFQAGYPLYACPSAHDPVVPSWPSARQSDPDGFGRLIPHLTGLAHQDRALPTTAAAQGRVLYRTVAGAMLELDRTAVLRLAAVNSQATCSQIDRQLASRTRASDDDARRQECWLQLVECGLILLEPPRAG